MVSFKRSSLALFALLILVVAAIPAVAQETTASTPEAWVASASRNAVKIIVSAPSAIPTRSINETTNWRPWPCPRCGRCYAADARLKLKPQNLLLNLPLARLQ